MPVGGFDMECHYGIILIIKCKIVPKKRKMQNILILADGINAERFIERIAQKRIGENYYTVVAPREIVYDTRHASNLELRQFDPTSLTKLRAIFKPEHFSLVFIVMDTDEEARASWDNVRQLDAKIPIVLLDRWGSFSVLHESATHVVDEAQLVASRLFDHLPNVPVVAQNVGLAQGEIMEVLVSYGSSFAYRHIGSIPQNKWKIAAIYREQKLILPTNATMIRPQDTLLIIGKPQVLLNIYHRISKKEGRFPEPFGRNLHLMIDLQYGEDQAMIQLREAIYLLERLDECELFVRLLNPGSLESVKEIQAHQNDRIHIHVWYGESDLSSLVLEDLNRFRSGLVMIDPKLFGHKGVAERLLEQKKLVLLFGDSPLYSVRRSVVLLSDEEEMESISSTLFFVSEALELEPCLCHFDPEGDFESQKRIVEHYETLSRIFNYPIKVEQKTLNPIRALETMDHILQIVPFTPALLKGDFFKIFSTRLSDYLLDSTHHPKLLIPAEAG